MKTKRVLLASAVCLAPFAAHAADMAVKAPIYKAPPAFSWTGFYIGLSGGLVSQGSHVDAFFTAPTVQDSFGITGSGFIGGGDVGYNWQFDPHWVIGVEADLSGTSLDDSSSLGTLPFSSRLDALGTVRARFGYAFDRALLYATGGWAYGHVRNAVEGGPGSLDGSTDRWESGWTAGGGLEYAITPNTWTVRVEALYVDLGSHTVDFLFAGNDCRFGFKNHYTIGRLGVNYKF
jgi:outer membrane immunogenic protein